MSEIIKIPVELRDVQGKGASRRLRREGLVPGVVYGGDSDPANIQISSRFLLKALEDEGFYTSILELEAGNQRQKVILRDLQRHPYKPMVMHIDLQRISDTEELRMVVPLHFLNEAESPAGKKSGVVISHLVSDVEVTCLPKDLPEFIELDLAAMDVGSIIHLSEIPMPEGVTLTAHDEDLEAPVVTAQHVGTTSTSDEEDEEEGGETSIED